MKSSVIVRFGFDLRFTGADTEASGVAEMLTGGDADVDGMGALTTLVVLLDDGCCGIAENEPLLLGRDNGVGWPTKVGLDCEYGDICAGEATCWRYGMVGGTDTWRGIAIGTGVGAGEGPL